MLYKDNECYWGVPVPTWTNLAYIEEFFSRGILLTEHSFNICPTQWITISCLGYVKEQLSGGHLVYLSHLENEKVSPKETQRQYLRQRRNIKKQVGRNFTTWLSQYLQDTSSIHKEMLENWYPGIE